MALPTRGIAIRGPRGEGGSHDLGKLGATLPPHF